MNITNRKLKLLLENGYKPTITHYYYLCNVVDYVGEERVRKSFESIAHQGDEVIASCYNTTDDTIKIAKEYGFTTLNCEKDSLVFGESKARNNAIINSNCNFLVDLNINVEYPSYFTGIIRRLLKLYDFMHRRIWFRYRWNELKKYYGYCQVLYRPFLIEARGYDERTGFAMGSQMYGTKLMRDVFKTKPKAIDIGLIHKNHLDSKIPYLEKHHPNKSEHGQVIEFVDILINDIRKNFDEGIKKVKNSYW